MFPLRTQGRQILQQTRLPAPSYQKNPASMYLNEPNPVPPCGPDAGPPLQTEGPPSLRPGLSAQIVPLRDETRARFTLATPAAALILSVDPDGHAGRAGLRHGDLLIGVDGHPVGSLEEIERRLADLAPESEPVFKVVRMGREFLLRPRRC